MNASLMSRTRMPKDLSLAARLIRYLIPNVSGVAAHMSSRYCPVLNCRTPNLHWTLSPRHPPTQTMSSALCSGGNLCTSSNASFFLSHSQVNATSVLQLLEWDFPDHANASRVRSIDGLSHNMSFTSEIRATKFVFLTLFEFTRLVHSFCCVCVECFIGINHHSFNCFSTLIGIGSATLTTRTMWSSAVCLKNVSAEICSSRSHFRPFFCWTCNNELFTGTAKDRSVSIPRITNAGSQERSVPGIAARKSSHHSPHQCSAWCQQNEQIFFFLAS